ncbi:MULTISPECIES: hypothetical protein [Paraburkholderia]|uniref:Uncharacterized protein n=1 Tax=Paraburkholderia podalyriae TaxID=1938811 RepID=A0ABR7PYN1_9BURK|nr:hypothetical protein [Paraburkholderia podalyriae]MBC8751294.1 hypothetical protein [Paraburkholderia podalyriae]
MGNATIDNHEESLESLIAQRDAINAKISRLRHAEEREAIEKYFPDEFAQFVRYMRAHNLALVYHGGNFKAHRVSDDIETLLCDGVRRAYPEERGFSMAFRHKMASALLDQVFEASSVYRESAA